MADAVLAREYIEFVSKGLDQIEAEMGKLRDKIENHLVPMQKLQDKVDGMKQSFVSMYDVGKKAFIGLTASITAWTTAGLAGTAQGEYLAISFKQLSQQIAAVFLPIVEKLASAVNKITLWFRSLTGAQQDNILRWAGMAAAFLGVMVLFPKVVAGIEAVKVALASFTAEALFAEGALTAGILPLIGLIVSGLAALAVGTDTGRDALGGLWDVLVKVGKAIGAVWDFLSMLVGKFIDFIGAISETIGLTKFLTDFVNHLAEAWGEIVSIFESLKPVMQSVFSFMEEAIISVTALAITLGRVLMQPWKALNFAKEFGIVESELQASYNKRQRDRNAPTPESGRKDVTMSGGNFEDISASFNRLQSSVLKAEGPNVAEKQLAVQEEIAENTRPKNVMEKQPIGNRGVALGVT